MNDNQSPGWERSKDLTFLAEGQHVVPQWPPLPVDREGEFEIVTVFGQRVRATFDPVRDGNGHYYWVVEQPAPEPDRTKHCNGRVVEWQVADWCRVTD